MATYTKRTTERVRGELDAFKKEIGKSVYTLMIDRCTNPKSLNYKNYGGRGITVCEEWMKDPDSFYLFAKTHGWKKGLQLDRIDNNKGYSPWNCRFVTAKENCRNTRANVPVAICDKDGNVLTTASSISEAAERTNTSAMTVNDSINKVIGVASGRYTFRKLVGECLPGWVISCLGKSVKVTNAKTGEVLWFETEHAAAKHYRVNHVSIRHWCMGMKVCKAEDADSLTFEYVPRSVFDKRPGAFYQPEFDLLPNEERRTSRFSWHSVKEAIRKPFTRFLTAS